MADRTAVMLLCVRSIYKVSVINRLGMTAATFCLQRYLICMVLRRMGTEVDHHTSMTLRTITGCRTRQLGPCVMTGITVVML